MQANVVHLKDWELPEEISAGVRRVAREQKISFEKALNRLFRAAVKAHGLDPAGSRFYVRTVPA